MTKPIPDWQIEWIDRGREPQCQPNPKYPEGIDLDSSEGAARTCFAALPYPAPRCGHFRVKCRTCGMTVVVTTAGRPDDPRSLKIACKGALNESARFARWVQGDIDETEFGGER